MSDLNSKYYKIYLLKKSIMIVDFDYQDITIVSKHANVSRVEAETALVEAEGDIARAMLLLTTK